MSSRQHVSAVPVEWKGEFKWCADEPRVGYRRGRAGSVPFVSHRSGAYGRLLLAVYVRWKTGLLVASDWLRPVTCVGWRAGPPVTARGEADVS